MTYTHPASQGRWQPKDGESPKPTVEAAKPGLIFNSEVKSRWRELWSAAAVWGRGKSIWDDVMPSDLTCCRASLINKDQHATPTSWPRSFKNIRHGERRNYIKNVVSCILVRKKTLIIGIQHKLKESHRSYSISHCYKKTTKVNWIGYGYAGIYVFLS